MGRLNLIITYDTLSGNTERFVKKLPFQCCHISRYDGTTPFILVTYTINFGQIPESTEKFLQVYHSKMIGVSSGGNKNWGRTYAIAANKISEQYKVPIISKFELQGTDVDVKNFIEGVEEMCQSG